MRLHFTATWHNIRSMHHWSFFFRILVVHLHTCCNFKQESSRECCFDHIPKQLEALGEVYETRKDSRCSRWVSKVDTEINKSTCIPNKCTINTSKKLLCDAAQCRSQPTRRAFQLTAEIKPDWIFPVEPLTTSSTCGREPTVWWPLTCCGSAIWRWGRTVRSISMGTPCKRCPSSKTWARPSTGLLELNSLRCTICRGIQSSPPTTWSSTCT